MNRYDIEQKLMKYAAEKFEQLGIVPWYGDYSCGRRKIIEEFDGRYHITISERNAWKALSYMADKFYGRYALGMPPKKVSDKILSAQEMSESPYEEREGISRLEEAKRAKETEYEWKARKSYELRRYGNLIPDWKERLSTYERECNKAIDKLDKEIALEEAKSKVVDMAAGDIGCLRDIERLRKLLINEAGNKIKAKDVVDVYRDSIRLAYKHKTSKELNRNLNLHDITMVLEELT